MTQGITWMLLGATLGGAAIGCRAINGIEDTRLLVDGGQGLVDSGPSLVVRGTATDVLLPFDLRLEFAGTFETLRITGDGPFTFTTPLTADSSYQVTLLDDAACILDGGSGVVGTEEPQISVRCDRIAGLQGIEIEGVTASFEFVPSQFDYTIDVPLLQEHVAVTAYAYSTEATILIGGTEVASGDAAPSTPLVLGPNGIEITVSHPQGWQRTYRLSLQRASRLLQYAYGKASNADAGDYFGWDLAVDGDTLAVGARYEDSATTGVDGQQEDNAATGSGAVYVFRRAGTTWVQEAYIKASNAEKEDNFGWSVALDRDTLVVGARGEDSAATGINGLQNDNGATDSGAVYVFRRTENVWAQEAYIKASNTNAEDNFGISVTVDGDVLAVGAWREDSSATGVDGDQADDKAPSSGAVYVFQRTGTSWAQSAYIKASNTGPADNFGWSLGLSGNLLAVGAPGEASASSSNPDDDSTPESGAVYVFRQEGGEWRQDSYLKASNPDQGDDFGWSVSLSGPYLAAAAPFESSAATGTNGNQADNSAIQSGAVYLFVDNDGNWSQMAYLKASNTNSGDNFGWSVALAQDTLAVSAVGESSAATGVGGRQSDDTIPQSGAVYLFRHTGTTWLVDAYVKAANTDREDQFGYDLALEANTLVVGAPFEDGSGRGFDSVDSDGSSELSGSVYVFH
jgi:trimeric autotransporter adhesin